MMTLLKIFSLVAITFVYADASCYVVENLKGAAAKEYGQYKLSNDGISNQKFMVKIDGKNSQVIPNDIGCMEVDINTLVCLYADEQGKQSSVETWAIFPESKKAVYTKTVNGYGEYNGGSLFIGDVIGKCNK